MTRFFSLWSINAPLEQRRLKRQMEQLQQAGMDGIVFHPRFYPNDPPYLSERYFAELSATILHAKSIGLAFWVYDEDGWPSGTVGGQLLKRFPEDAQRWIGLFKEPQGNCLAEFEHDASTWYLAEKRGAGVDYLKPELCRHFIEMTHESYRTGLLPEAFDYIETFFCDEPELGLGHVYDALPPNGAIPWTPRLPELFRERFGEDLLPLLPLLFFKEEGYPEVRIRFYEFLSDLFCEAFIAPINEWCRQHGKRFTAHVKGEEHPIFQVPIVGSCDPVYRHLSLPGIDALERHPANNYYPRQAASAAAQFGDGRCMAESFGGAGWGATPEDLERYLLWLGRNGITDFAMHLSQYRLTSAAIRDWPPSQPLHLNWSEAYPELLRRVRETLEREQPGAADTLIVSPHRAIMAEFEPWELMQTNIHNAATYPDSPAARINRRFLEQVERLHDSGVNYHVVDERTFEEHARSEQGGVQIGKCVYRHVLADVLVSPAAKHLLEAVGGIKEAVAKRTPIASKAQPSQTRIDLEWKVQPVTANALLLEPVREGANWFECNFEWDASLPGQGKLELVFVDPIASLTFNGHQVEAHKTEDEFVAPLAWMHVESNNTLRFQCASVADRPFVWVRGGFLVKSRTPFKSGPNGTVSTEGPFQLNAQTEGIHDFVGYPFLRRPLIAETTFDLPHLSSAIRFEAIKGDAARLNLDDQPPGWVWGPDWQPALQEALTSGDHKLRIELVPSTYNTFGPHHYIGGDSHVISPDQFSGKKNFADPADAPDRTLVSSWHFKPFQLPNSLLFS